MISLGVFACGDDEPEDGQGTDVTPDPEPLFRALEDDLIKTCGGPNGTCHVRGSFQQAPTWLGGPDPYVTVKRYRGVLPATKEVGDSILLTQVRHAGPALTDAPDDLYRRVSDWLTAEVPGPPLPNTGAFSVLSGFNSIPLDTVAPGLTDARLTFLATEMNGTLTLDALKLVAPPNANVKVDSPFFVILPRSGKVKAEPEVNGFKGELTVPAGDTVDLFTGKMILLRWDPTGQLKIAFNMIESTPGQSSGGGCTALDLFNSSALPAMGRLVDLLPDDDDDPEAPLGQGSCLGCHAKAPPANEGPAPAVQAMDLRAAATDPAAACAQAKIWINRENKAQSVILLNPTGKGNPQHPMRALTDNDPIIQGIKAWVDAEQ
ncbi:MAG: hypothetical protein KF894_22735 [Labilithrix sp.]|nr:hypothetical protein [Labilithrix sp.]